MSSLHLPGNKDSGERRNEPCFQETPLQVHQRFGNCASFVCQGKREVQNGIHFLKVTSVLIGPGVFLLLSYSLFQ